MSPRCLVVFIDIDPPCAKVLVRPVYVNAVCLVDARTQGPMRSLPKRPTIFSGRRPNIDLSPKKLFGEGVAGDQNVAGMWLKYGVKP